jgi:hypothetical protein
MTFAVGLAGVWLFLLVCNFAVGWPQKEEARGSLGRLLWVCAALAAVEALPAVIVAVLAARGAVAVDQWQIAFASTLFSLICVVPNLKPPVRLDS